MINQPQTIIHAKAGQQVPEELWKAALVQCPTVSGFAIRDTSDDKTTLEIEHYTQTGTVDDMTMLDERAKEYERVYYLANMPGVHTTDDVQPFALTILDGENDTIGTDILTFFLEGDFPKSSDSKSGHTDEYNFAQEIVIPTLQDLFNANSQDVALFTGALHKPLFEKNMMAHVGHRAAFVFLPLEGDPVKFGTNELGLGDEWGSCSQHLNFAKAAKPITSTAAAVAKVAGKFNIFKKTEPTAEPLLPDGVHLVPEKKPAEDWKVGPDTAINAGKKLIKPPSKLDKSARNRWLRAFNNGDLPPNHDHSNFQGLWISPEVLPYAQRQDIHTVAQVAALADEMRKGIKSSPKDMRSPTVSDYIPILSDKEMIDLTGTLAKFIDRDKVPSALDIQKMEAPWPVFSEKSGIPFIDTFRWRLGEEISKLERKALELLYLETRRELIQKWDPSGFVASVKVGAETAKHVAAKEILKPGETKQVGSTTFKAAAEPTTAAAKRNALFGIKKSA